MGGLGDRRDGGVGLGDRRRSSGCLGDRRDGVVSHFADHLRPHAVAVDVAVDLADHLRPDHLADHLGPHRVAIYPVV